MDKMGKSSDPTILISRKFVCLFVGLSIADFAVTDHEARSAEFRVTQYPSEVIRQRRLRS